MAMNHDSAWARYIQTPVSEENEFCDHEVLFIFQLYTHHTSTTQNIKVKSNENYFRAYPRA